MAEFTFFFFSFYLIGSFYHHQHHHPTTILIFIVIFILCYFYSFIYLFSRHVGTQGRFSLPPPIRTAGSANFFPKYPQISPFEHNAGVYNGASAPPSENSARNIQVRTFKKLLKYWVGCLV